MFNKISKEMKYNYPLIIKGIFIGIISGLVVSLYRFLIHNAEAISQGIYSFARENLWAIIPLAVALIVMGIFVGYLTKKDPMIKGSGIPQIEGQIEGLFTINWWRVLLIKIIGGTVSIVAGLSLGREGPSIQLGSAAAEGFAKGIKAKDDEKIHMITCGASAGLAAAFNAPLAGMVFALEEVHKNFSPTVLLSALAASVAGDVVSKSLFGTMPVFNGWILTEFPLKHYLMLPVLGIILGICGWFYNKTLLGTQKLYKKINTKHTEFVMIIPFLFAGIAGLFMPDILGGGGRIISSLINKEYAITYILILLLAKFIFSMISFGSGAPGGIFFPLLVLGGLVGTIFGYIAIEYFGVSEVFYLNFLFLGMVGMFTGIVRAPLTGIILIVEMSGSITQMLSLSVVALFAYLAAEFLGSKPIYDSLLDNIKNK